MMNDVTQLPGVVTAEVVGVDGNGRPLVDCSGTGPISALAVWIPGAPSWSDCIGARILVGFINGDETQPIVIGLLEAPAVVGNSVSAHEPVPQTLRIEAGKEMVIECGEAKISLRKDGRIEIRGTHLISRSSGPNKIKGGSVFIN